MTGQEHARISIDAIKEKLDRVVSYLATYPDTIDQWAIRILRSRQRYLERIYLMMYGTAFEKEIVNIELSLKTQDIGKLIKDPNGKQHSQGRLDCKACDTYTVDNSDRVRPMTSLCTECKEGLKHVYTVIKEVEPLSGMGQAVPIACSGSILQPSLLCKRISQCENCGVITRLEEWREDPQDDINVMREIKIKL